MAKDRLKSRIAAALQGASARDELRQILAGGGEAGRVARRSVVRPILDDVKDPILVVDPDGIVQEANAAGARLLDADVEVIVGQDIARFIPTLAPALPTLDALAERVADTFVDATPELIEIRCGDGRRLTVEVTVSRAGGGPTTCFVLCMRDVTGRLHDEQALRDSEARYRALVENAPEAIVVLDVDRNVFVEVNDNAVKLFKVSREELLLMGPEALSPERQSDGQPSGGLHVSYVERALRGARPVFEWLHCDGQGNEIPCEVRFIRLPSSKQRLIRASIIDNAARRHADALAYGERRVLELVAANAPLERTLLSVVRLVDQLHPGVLASISLLDARGGELGLVAANGLSPSLSEALTKLPIGLRSGSCGVAASLGRQVVIRDVATDPLWAELATVAVASGVRACCSTPITADDRVSGTLALYFATERSPNTEELDLVTRLTQLAGIAIRRKQDETALRESEARFRSLFDNVVDGVYQTAPSGELLSANPALVQMLGLEEGAFGRCNMAEFFVDAKERARLVSELIAYGRVRHFEYQLRTRTGRVIVVIENSRLVTAGDGRPLYFEGTITDITQRKAAERALFNEKERAQVTLQSIGDAVVTTDARGNIEYLNPVAEQLTGWDAREAHGSPIENVIVIRDEISGEPVVNPVSHCLQEGRVVTLSDSVVLVARDGSTIAIQDSAAPIQDRNGQTVGAVMVFHDVRHERQLHRRLAYLASHDALTGFINRREVEERLSTVLATVKAEPKKTAALLYMDLDQFKVVNDTCGHSAGDLLLRQLGDVLRARVPKSGVLARLGGDEFAVLLPDFTLPQAAEIAESLREAIASFRFSWRDSAMQVGVSIGIVPVEAASESVAALMSAADVACYVAKDLGRNRIHVYEEGDAAERHQEMQWVARITRALEQERFELYYQPIVPIRSDQGHWPHYELLLRMRDEEGKLIAPTAFIPAAERYNLMPGLDRWVVSHTFETLAYRGDPGAKPYTLAINLSGTTLNDARFLDFVLDELTAAAIAPGAICFEITETAAIANLDRVISFMRALKARGCRFSLDDFGTGLSSLTYLKNLPVDYVKIDGQFVRNVLRDGADECVVESIARMARAFRIHAIAERVESRDVMKRLGELGVSFAQGYFVAVPQPVSELPVHPQSTAAGRESATIRRA
jgi:diguanylate cyclase (GGDEF)-like protein/PAS domain S-box-containing protein